MNRSASGREENGFRLISLLNHAPILAEIDPFLTEDRFYKLISFCSPEAPETITMLYRRILETLSPLIRDRYEYLHGEVHRRLLLLFQLPQLSYQADSVWIDSVSGTVAAQFPGVTYSSSMPQQGLIGLRGAHIQVIEEEEFNYFSQRRRHREENDNADILGDYYSEQQLFDSLSRRFELAALAGKVTLVHELLEETLDKIVSLRPYSIPEVHRRLEMFVHVLLHRLDRDGWPMPGEDRRREILTRLLFCDTEQELRAQAALLTEELLRGLRNTPRNSEVVANHVQAYIDANLRDVNLCLTGIAEVFERKSRALNELFHQIYGISIFRYIQAQRLALAERLLTETDLDVIRVCEQAGYGSMNTMIRAFRQTHGLSPSAYRDRAGNTSK